MKDEAVWVEEVPIEENKSLERRREEGDPRQKSKMKTKVQFEIFRSVLKGAK